MLSTLKEDIEVWRTVINDFRGKDRALHSQSGLNVERYVDVVVVERL